MSNIAINIGKNSVSIALKNNTGISISVGEIEHEASPTIGNYTAKLEWSNTLLDGESVSYSAAEKAAAELGKGWRLPTRFELESLLDLSRHDPAIDAEKYPDTKSSYYWTSTPCAWNETAVWIVNFDLGYVYDCLRGYGACVRAVRASQ